MDGNEGKFRETVAAGKVRFAGHAWLASFPSECSRKKHLPFLALSTEKRHRQEGKKECGGKTGSDPVIPETLLGRNRDAVILFPIVSRQK